MIDSCANHHKISLARCPPGPTSATVNAREYPYIIALCLLSSLPATDKLLAPIYNHSALEFIPSKDAPLKFHYFLEALVIPV